MRPILRFTQKKQNTTAISLTKVKIYYIIHKHDIIEVWISLVEHCVRDAGVASSNLVTSTIEKEYPRGYSFHFICFSAFYNIHPVHPYQ